MLEWLHDRPANPKETISTVQDVDKDGIKYVSHDNTESNWVAPDGPLRVPDRPCAIAITADVSFKLALVADFKREFKIIEFFWKQRPDVGGMIALPLLHPRYQRNICVSWLLRPLISNT